MMRSSGGKNKQLLGTMLMCLLAYSDFPFDWGAIGYPQMGENGEKEWKTVCYPQNLSPDVVYPKEQALLDTIRSEHGQGRKVWVYGVFTDKRDVVGRLEGLVRKAGYRVTTLRAKVSPRDRERWIEANGRDNDVIISHPDLVKTGLDFFSKVPGGHNFPTICFYETGYNLFTLMQASRRAWRIGQKRECRTFYFYYADTIQARAMKLMGDKAVAANAINGRFTTEGLTAMSSEAETMEMALARALVERTQGPSAALAWARLTTPLVEKPQVTKETVANLQGTLARLRALRQQKMFS